MEASEVMARKNLSAKNLSKSCLFCWWPRLFFSYVATVSSRTLKSRYAFGQRQRSLIYVIRIFPLSKYVAWRVWSNEESVRNFKLRYCRCILPMNKSIFKIWKQRALDFSEVLACPVVCPKASPLKTSRHEHDCHMAIYYLISSAYVMYANRLYGCFYWKKYRVQTIDRPRKERSLSCWFFAITALSKI